MNDRIPLYPGRVKMTPVAGQANTYDMVRADDPTQPGTPLNKATFLKDATAALYGLGTSAVPDDVLSYLALSITTQHGIIAVKVNITNTIKSPITLSISPAVEVGRTVQTTEDGWFIGYAAPGTYSVKVDTSAFLTSPDSAKQVVVKAGKISTPLSFTATFLETGTLKITSSKTLTVPSILIGKTFDFFVVGGGGGGGASAGISAAGGGGGGLTATRLNYTVNASSIKINIGSGGAGGVASDYGDDGKGGGATSVVISGTTVVSANGGSGAYYRAGWSAEGGIGGSGGGCGNRGAAPDGGSDGSNGKGGLSTDTDWGTGQGTTTRAFGESTGELFAGGGGGVFYNSGYTIGVGGSGGGGRGGSITGSAGTDGTGGGGGGALSYSKQQTTGGRGGSGAAILRW